MKLNIAYVVALIVTITIPSAFADSISTEIDGISYDIDYTGNNIILKTATADLDFISLIFETLMGVFRIRLQCGKSGRVSRMTLGLVKNASNHYMANPM